MRIVGVFAVALFAAAPVAAQDDRHAVAPNINWSITDSDCAIDASWEDEVAVLVTRHEDHHDLGVYDPHFVGVVDGEVTKVRLGTGGSAADAQDYDAAMSTGEKTKSFVIAIDDPMLDELAASGVLQLFRGRSTIADLDISGFDVAVAAMRACEAGQTVPLDSIEAAAAAEAAADAALTGMEPQ